MAVVLLAGLAGPFLAGGCGGKTPSSPTPVPTPLTTTGQVIDAFTRAPIPSVSLQPTTGAPTTSDAAGNFALQTAGSGALTTTLTSGSTVERVVAIRVPGPSTTVSLVPASFDMAAFSQMVRIGGTLQRWVAAPPLVVVKRTLAFTSYSNDTFTANGEVMSQAEAEAVVADLRDGFRALTSDAIGSFPDVTYVEVAEGASVTVNRVGSITVARYQWLTRDSGYWGYGRWATNGASQVVGGIVMLDRDFDTSMTPYRRSLRIHELGHALGYDHVTLRASAMNRTATIEPNEWDRQAVALAFQRPPGNRSPDADPAGTTANLTPAGRLRGVRWGPIIP